MYKEPIFIDWQILEQTALFVVILVMIFILFKGVKYVQKALTAGIGLFVLSIFISFFGLTRISDSLSAFGFIITAMALVSLFWVDNGNRK